MMPDSNGSYAGSSEIAPTLTALFFGAGMTLEVVPFIYLDSFLSICLLVRFFSCGFLHLLRISLQTGTLILIGEADFFLNFKLLFLVSFDL